MVWSLIGLIVHARECRAEINGKWIPARPENYKLRSYRTKLKHAWLVFTGKADCVIWPGGQ